MSKESSAGTVCRCGMTIVFHDQHWRNCPEKDNWQLGKKVKEEKKSGRSKRK